MKTIKFIAVNAPYSREVKVSLPLFVRTFTGCGCVAVSQLETEVMSYNMIYMDNNERVFGNLFLFIAFCKKYHITYVDVKNVV